MKELKFVDVGEGITEGHLQKWLVKDGEMVKEDQPIAQIETDKAVVNLPAPISGKVKIVAKEDSTVNVGDMLAIIGTDSELQGVASAPSQRSAAPAAQQPAMQKPAQVTGPAQNVHGIIATPAVRKLAHELGIEINTIAGTGPGGRILESDLGGQNHIAAAPAAKAAPKFSQSLEQKHWEEIERIPMSMTRKAIARNMEASWTIPRAAHMDIIDATALFEIVKREKPRVEKEFGVKLTFLPFIIKALVAALKDKQNERFNSSYDREKSEILIKRYYNIGLAAEAPDGLKVVVIKDADKKSIIQIAKEIRELGDRVRNQTVTLEDMQDSTMTITNIGSLGGGYLSVPMINYPEVAILGIHLVRDSPVVKEDKVVVGKILPFSLVFDHRVVDGAEAVHMGNELIEYLQDPDFLEMI
ncbi:MAG: 2-oxo acid dehydrogenase subunit E2 [Candidatus Micrarchaeota archaeon]|nr:2-oxo acid dehydrogenase subunit E2 [Candidatus Micrarchaeota archaeon]MDE1848303.1 2-oxo acid dehydrogenase subunit E2 [Candidatus Micrarchaeota archaeon]MDE1864756.1 2-oxo acid dehydrogenase subunit E2 [Candidatus Micrarchaeota archaeon]